MPSQLIAAEMDESGAETSVTAGIESSFTNNTLTMQTTGSVISSAQSIFANKVVVTYKKK